MPQDSASSSSTTTIARDGVEMTRVSTREEEEEDYHDESIPPTSRHSAGDKLADSAKHAIHRFFYPPSSATANTGGDDHAVELRERGAELDDEDPAVLSPAVAVGCASTNNGINNSNNNYNSVDDRVFVHNFWTTYDDILILSIFTQLGIVFRLAAASWFARFDDVFSHASPLFVNLPLNCLSCFIMGLLGSGERLMEVIGTRFSPATTQLDIANHNNHNNTTPANDHHPGDDDDDDDDDNPEQVLEESKFLRMRRRRRGRRRVNEKPFHSWQPPVQLHQDLRDVQLMALERRIRLSKCLLLFPLKKQDVDVMEHYFDGGYQKQPPPQPLEDSLDDLVLREEGEDSMIADDSQKARETQHGRMRPTAPTTPTILSSPLQVSSNVPPTSSSESSLDSDHSPSDEANPENSYLTDFTSNVQENVTANIHRWNRLQSNSLFINGWDSGTTFNDMSDDLLLGLRDGFCGALSSFSSWNSSMVALLRQTEISKAVVGYVLGVQLPIIAYRFGQHVAVYIFVWRTRRETRVAERRGGYGIRLAQQEVDTTTVAEQRRIPSLRAVFTALFVVALVGQCTSIWLFRESDDQQIALSLLFSPLGVLARWRLSKWNSWKPTFPIGTFTANLLACALSGSLGSLIAGNPGPEERIVLVSIVAGFGGTLSSLATFIVEILAGIDPILFRFDGMLYAVASIAGALVIGFVLSASVEWADETVLQAAGNEL